MRSGIHIWSIKLVVEDAVHMCWLGVALAADLVDRHEFLGQQAGGWVYGSDGTSGAVSHNNQHTRYGIPVYDEGSIVRFRLDLTQQGTLSASVDAGEEFLLFDNMLMIGEDKVDRSFVPAASLTAPVAVRFLGFHRGG